MASSRMLASLVALSKDKAWLLECSEARERGQTVEGGRNLVTEEDLGRACRCSPAQIADAIKRLANRTGTNRHEAIVSRALLCQQAELQDALDYARFLDLPDFADSARNVALALGIWAGLSVDEARNLQWEDLDSKTMHIKVWRYDA
jgi:integrase